MRYNVVILRGRFRLEGLSCLRYDINEHSELGRGDVFHGRRSHGGVIGSWLHISGPMVYILDLYGCQRLRKRMTGVFTSIAGHFKHMGMGLVSGKLDTRSYPAS